MVGSSGRLHVVLAFDGVIPVSAYGGTQRVVWYLGKELARLGHRVTFLVSAGSHCDFADVVHRDPATPLARQVPAGADLVHFHSPPPADFDRPHLFTMHGNRNDRRPLPLNTVFVSRNHAGRFGSDSFVHNGLDWDDYGPVELCGRRTHFHFLGNAAWRVKNVRGAIRVVERTPDARLAVIGGTRLNFRMGFRLTLSRRVRFYGTIGGAQKLALLRASKGLVFPVLWHEPFGLALPESLYFGCPVFGTPYGSLPEIVHERVGTLSNRAAALAEALGNADGFSTRECHDYAVEMFSAQRMARAYVERYGRVLDGGTLNRAAPVLQDIQHARFLEWHD
jgi:glycosyltransferase involved in cell wall biosynthesis